MTKSGIAVAAVWNATPIAKTKQAKIKPNLKLAQLGKELILSANRITNGVGRKCAKKSTS
jgi:hypothetical protein